MCAERRKTKGGINYIERVPARIKWPEEIQSRRYERTECGFMRIAIRPIWDSLNEEKRNTQKVEKTGGSIESSCS